MKSQKYIDKNDMYKSVYDFSLHIDEAIGIGKKINFKKNYNKISNIVLCGMGGSAIGGDLSSSLARHSLSVPVQVNRNYTLPSWVNNETLVICSSYSGNTEESLSAYHEALSKGSKIVGISTGGELTTSLKKNDFDFVIVPSGLQPRAAVSFSFIPLLYILNEINVINPSLIRKIESASKKIKNYTQKYCTTEDTNPTYALAKKIHNTLPIIYGESDLTSAIAVRWKGQVCENSKMLAFHNDIPEMNHNEIVGWQENTDIMKRLSVLWILDKSTHPRNKLRFDSSKEILNTLPFLQEEISLKGETFVERFIHLIHFGDWLSYWCAILHQTDPTPVEKIDTLKMILSKKS